MTLTTERLAELRAIYFRVPNVLALIDEVERLRAVIRSTHSEFCEGVERLQRHMPGCKLYEIES